MVGNGKLVIAMLLTISMIGLACASNPFLGYAKVNSDFNFTQICLINGSICDGCNVTSIKEPVTKRELVRSITMVKRPTDFFYNIDSPNITRLGDYNVEGFCWYGDDVKKPFITHFTSTPTGESISVGDSILYALFSAIFFCIISLLAFFVFIMPSKNERDNRDFESKILKVKYLRIFFIGLIYGLSILLLNFLNGLAVNFSTLSMFAGIFGFLFNIMLRLAWPFTVFLMAWIIVMLIHDTNLNKQLKRFENFDPLSQYE